MQNYLKHMNYKKIKDDYFKYFIQNFILYKYAIIYITLLLQKMSIILLIKSYFALVKLRK